MMMLRMKTSALVLLIVRLGLNLIILMPGRMATAEGRELGEREIVLDGISSLKNQVCHAPARCIFQMFIMSHMSSGPPPSLVLQYFD